MKLLSALTLALCLTACGKSGGSTTQQSPIPTTPTGGSTQTTLYASRLSDNTTSTGLAVIQQPGQVVIPSAADLVVTANATDFYHAYLNIGNVSCDYIHDAGTSGFHMGSGCTTVDPTVPVAPGDHLTLSIPNVVSQTTQVQVTLLIKN